MSSTVGGSLSHVGPSFAHRGVQGASAAKQSAKSEEANESSSAKLTEALSSNKKNQHKRAASGANSALIGRLINKLA